MVFYHFHKRYSNRTAYGIFEIWLKSQLPKGFLGSLRF